MFYHNISSHLNVLTSSLHTHPRRKAKLIDSCDESIQYSVSAIVYCHPQAHDQQAKAIYSSIDHVYVELQELLVLNCLGVYFIISCEQCTELSLSITQSE